MNLRGALYATVVAATAWTGYVYVDQLPPNSLPWKPVVLNAPPRWLAHAQLNRLTRDGAACKTALATAALSYTPLADHITGDECGFTDVVRLEKTSVAFRPTVTATCGLSAALVWYEDGLRALARADLNTELVAIEHVGTYACRNINSEAAGPRSEHATANAIDVVGFRFADGRTVSVGRDYGAASPAGKFLDDAHAQACALFNVVLGPHYNRLHATHFHLDMGGYHMCS